MQKTLTVGLLLAIFYLLISVQLNTPMHSDDFSYYLKGGNLALLYDHYMSWSGRVVADFISSSLLYYFSFELYSILNSIALVALIFLISYLPVSLNINSDSLNLAIVIVFLCYWLSNPALGQTTFWIVGSANYLWTYLLILIMFNHLFIILNKSRVSAINYLFCIVISFVSGCTNEATGYIPALLALFLYMFYKKRIFIVSFFSSLSGFLILIFSPGNYNRSLHENFSSWISLDLVDKVYLHMISRLPNIMSELWLPLIISLIISYLYLGRETENRKIESIAPLLFLLFAILSVVSLLFAPYIANRTLNGTLVLMLICLSFSLHRINLKQVSMLGKISIVLTVFTLSFLFIPSYQGILNSYKSVNKQGEIRKALIEEAYYKGFTSVTIPGFYFPYLMKEGDSLDAYHSPSMAKYYNISDIAVVEVNVDYSEFKADKVKEIIIRQ